ncbi:MAG TPA: poly-gamma-glutamate hydrolase family protein [Acidimicrobiales bacterium]|jgi:phage replication-related protein YjqB (UPF0714/DUF867 family)|nr:poly-gamma-glutamate hydrolase family protein [Acidimicrobiales bacterium]
MSRAFAELLAEPGVQEVVELRSAFGFMAFHGGSLERMTDVIALDAAERAGASVYAVVQPADLRWHIPSHQVDGSPALSAFLAHVDVAVALHGFGREGCWHQLLLGGSNRALATHVAGVLRPALAGFEVVDALDRIPRPLQGLHPSNPVNRPAGGGVQVELPPRVRGLTPHGLSIEPLVAALAAAAAAWPHSMSKVPPARQ